MRVMVLALTVAVTLAPVAGATAVPAAAHGTATEPTADARSGPVSTTLATSSSNANVSLTAYALDNSIQAGSNATILFSVDNQEPNASVLVALTNVPANWTKVVVDDDGASTELNASTAHALHYPNVNQGDTLSPTLNTYVPSDTVSGEYNLTAVVTAGDGTVREDITLTVSGGTTSTDGVLQKPAGGGNPSGLCYYNGSYDKDAIPTTWEPYHFDGLANDEDRDAGEYHFQGNFNNEIGMMDVRDALQLLDCGFPGMDIRDVARALDFEGQPVSYPDSDGDGLTDREEAVFRKNGHNVKVYEVNADNDQFSDYRDARPATEDIPPEVNISSGDYADELVVSATDGAGLSLISLHEKGTDTYTNRPISGSSADESFSPLDLGTEYWVNVSDINGNKYTILLAVQSDGSAKIKKAGVAVFAGSVGTPVVGDEVIGTSVLLAAFALAAVVSYTSNSGIDLNTVYTSNAAGYENADTSVTQHFTDEQLPIRLPSGHHDSVSDPAPTIGEVDRGYGWEYIERQLPSITKHQIGDILRTPSKVEELDGGALVIGDNPNGEGEIWLIIGGGAVLNAANIIEEYNLPDDYNGEYSDRRFALTEEDWDHVQDRGDHLTQEQIRKTIQNPDEIWIDASQGLAVFIRQANGKYQIVRTWDFDEVAPNIEETFFHVGAAFEGTAEDADSEVDGLTQDYP